MATPSVRVPVQQITGVAPQVMIVVLKRSEARTVHENGHILQGTRVILPIDRKRSVVIYSNTASDWNIVAAVAKLHVTKDTVPFIVHNLPKSLRDVAQSVGMVVLWAAFVVFTSVLSYELASYLGSLTAGFLFADPWQVARRAVHSLRNGSMEIVMAYLKLVDFIRCGGQLLAKYIITFLEAYVAQGSGSEGQNAIEAHA